LDNAKSGSEISPCPLFGGDLNALERVLNKARAMPPDDALKITPVAVIPRMPMLACKRSWGVSG